MKVICSSVGCKCTHAMRVWLPILAGLCRFACTAISRRTGTSVHCTERCRFTCTRTFCRPCCGRLHFPPVPFLARCLGHAKALSFVLLVFFALAARRVRIKLCRFHSSSLLSDIAVSFCRGMWNDMARWSVLFSSRAVRILRVATFRLPHAACTAGTFLATLNFALLPPPRALRRWVHASS